MRSSWSAAAVVLTACMSSPAPRPVRPAAAVDDPAAAAAPASGAHVAGGSRAPEREGGELIGKQAPEWRAERWLHSPPLTLGSLRGKVVFARWWTADCPYCSASAAALRALHEEYEARGLVVIGFYHHKEKTPFDPSVFVSTAKRYGFTFPLALDPDWSTIDAWWLQGHDRRFTSASFLIDKQGRFRFVHPGGTLALGSAGDTELRAAIDAALAE